MFSNNGNTFSGGLTSASGILRVSTVNNASTAGQLGNNSSVTLGGVNGTTGTLEYTGANASSSMVFNMAANGTGNFQVDSAATTLTLSSAVTGTTGGSLAMSGSGTLKLTTAPTYTGATTVNSGTLLLAFASGNPATSSYTINSGGTLAILNSNDLVGTNGAAATAVATAINAGGTLTVAVNGVTVHVGALNLNGGTLASTGTPSGNGLTYGSYNLDAAVTTGGTPVTSVISAQDVALTQSGGTVFNVYAGGTPNGIDLE